MAKDGKNENKDKGYIKSLYSRTVSEKSLGLSINNKTGYNNQKIDYTMHFSIDPRQFGLGLNSNYSKDTNMSVRCHELENGKIEIIGMQLIEPKESAIEDELGKRIIKSGEITGTSDIQTYNFPFISNPRSKYTNFTMTENVNFEREGLSKNRVSINKPPRKQVEASIMMDVITKDYVGLTKIGKNSNISHYVNNTENNYPIEIDSSIAEKMAFLTKSEYERYLSIQKAKNPNFEGLNSNNFNTSVSNYEIMKVSSYFGKYLKEDSNIFQSQGDLIDENGFIRPNNSKESQDLLNSVSKAVEVYQLYSKELNLNLENETLNYDNLSEVKRNVMNKTEVILSNSEFEKEIKSIMNDLDKNINISLKNEVEAKINDIKSGPKFINYDSMIFDLNNRSNYYDAALKYSNAAENWNNIELEFTDKVINSNTNKNGELNVELAKKDSLSELGIVDIKNIQYKSRDELEVIWNNLERQLKVNVPQSPSMSIDVEKAVNFRNAQASMEIIKDLIINHKDNYTLKINPYASSNIDDLIVDISTKSSFENLKKIDMNNSQDRVNGQVLKELNINEFYNRNHILDARLSLLAENKNLSLKIGNSNFNYNSLINDKDVTKLIDEFSDKLHKMNMSDINKEIANISDKISESNRLRMEESIGNPVKLLEIKEELKTKDELVRTIVKNQILIKIIDNHISVNDYTLNVEKYMEFAALNNKTKIAEYMGKNHSKILELYKEGNPNNSSSPYLHERGVDNIKLELSKTLNISNSELEFLSSENNNFFKGRHFEKLIFDNGSLGVNYLTFEKATEMFDIKNDLQNPEKCREAYELLNQKINKLSNAESSEGKDFHSNKGTLGGILDDGNKTSLEEYRMFLETHIIENKIRLLSEKLEISNFKDESLNIQYSLTDKNIIKENNFSNSYVSDINNPSKLIEELKALEYLNEQDSLEYNFISEKLYNHKVSYVENDFSGKLNNVLNNELAKEYIVSNSTDFSSENISRLINEFENINGIKIDENSISKEELLNKKVDLELSVLIKENNIREVSYIKEEYLNTFDKKDLKVVSDKINGFNEDKEALIKEPSVQDLKANIYNPIYCKGFIDLTSNERLKDNVSEYVDSQNDVIKNDLLINNYHNKLIEHGLIDVNAYSNKTKDLEIISKTNLYKDLIKADEKSYSISDSSINAYNKNQVKLTQTFSSTSNDNNKEFNIGSIENLVNKRMSNGNSELLNQKIEELKLLDSKISNKSEMSNISEYNLYNKISSRQDLSSEIILADLKLKNNPVYESVPSSSHLMQIIEKSKKDLRLEESKLEKLESKYDFNLEGVGFVDRFKLTMASFKEKDEIDRTRTEIDETNSRIDAIKNKIKESESEINNYENVLDLAKVKLEKEKEKLSKSMNEVLNVLKVDSNSINDFIIDSQNNNFKTHVNLSENDKLFISDIYSGNKNIYDLNKDEALKIVESISYFRDKEIDKSSDFNNIRELSKMNQGPEILSAYDSYKNYESYIDTSLYKDNLSTILDINKNMMSQEYNNIIENNLGYIHESSVDAVKLENMFKKCEKSYNEIEHISSELKSLNISLKEGGVSSNSILSSTIKLYDVIDAHNKNIESLNNNLNSKNGKEVIETVNKEILTESSSTNKIREDILIKMGKNSNVNYGHEVFNSDYIKPYDIESVITKMKLEELRDEIMIYQKEIDISEKTLIKEDVAEKVENVKKVSSDEDFDTESVTFDSSEEGLTPEQIAENIEAYANGEIQPNFSDDVENAHDIDEVDDSYRQYEIR